MKKTVLSGACASLLILSMPSHALDAASTQQYCEDVKNAGKSAMERYVQQRSPKQAPSNIFNDSVQSCMANIANMGIAINMPGIGNIMGMVEGLAKQAMDSICQAATDQFNHAVNDALGAVNENFKEFNSSTGMGVGVGTNNNGGVNVGSAGTVADAAGQQGSQIINGNLNFD